MTIFTITNSTFYCVPFWSCELSLPFISKLFSFWNFAFLSTHKYARIRFDSIANSERKDGAHSCRTCREGRLCATTGGVRGQHKRQGQRTQKSARHRVSPISLFRGWNDISALCRPLCSLFINVRIGLGDIDCFISFCDWCFERGGGRRTAVFFAKQHKRTALIASAYFGHEDCVRLLLELGVDKDSKDNVRVLKFKCSVLIWASSELIMKRSKFACMKFNVHALNRTAVLHYFMPISMVTSPARVCLMFEYLSGSDNCQHWAACAMHVAECVYWVASISTVKILADVLICISLSHVCSFSDIWLANGDRWVRRALGRKLIVFGNKKDTGTRRKVAKWIKVDMLSIEITALEGIKVTAGREKKMTRNSEKLRTLFGQMHDFLSTTQSSDASVNATAQKRIETEKQNGEKIFKREKSEKSSHSLIA